MFGTDVASRGAEGGTEGKSRGGGGGGEAMISGGPRYHLRACYAMSGTELAAHALATRCLVPSKRVVLPSCYALCSTEPAYGATLLLRDVQY
eukprot:1526424-Rhodomonas_salina.1